MRIAIIGVRGQLGTALMRAFQGHPTVGWTRQDFDIRDEGPMAIAVRTSRPDIVINTAAFHSTDACEDEPQMAFAVNATAVRNLARVCRAEGTVLVHISTDYVFRGDKDRPYVEDDPPDPINTYGISKLAGEQFIRAICDRYLIVRVASLFGFGRSGKRNFVEFVLGNAERGEPLRIVTDVVMSPTYANDAAGSIRRLVEAHAPSGVYHVTNAGACTWHAFASEILRQAGHDVVVIPTTLSALAPKAVRPANSALASNRLRERGLGLRPWRDALAAYLEERGLLKASVEAGDGAVAPSHGS